MSWAQYSNVLFENRIFGGGPSEYTSDRVPSAEASLDLQQNGSITWLTLVAIVVGPTLTIVFHRADAASVCMCFRSSLMRYATANRDANNAGDDLYQPAY